MFNRSFFLIVMGLALLLIAPRYVNAEPSGKSMTPPTPQATSQASKEQPAPRSVTGFTPAEKQAYLKKMAQNLQDMQQRIENLKLKTRTIQPQKKHMTLLALVDLQRRFNSSKQKLAALQGGPGKNWNNLKSEMDESMVNLAKAVDALEAHL